MSELRPPAITTESERHALIKAVLRDRSFATVRDLVAVTRASPATIRRDIDKLDGAGEVRKVYGGITAVEGLVPREGLSARPFDENRWLAVEAKKAIALEAEKLCRDGESLIINAGTTCYLFGILLARRPVKIFTNSMPLAAHLAENGTCALTVSGGELHREPGIIQAVPATPPDVYASKFFVGAQGTAPPASLNPIRSSCAACSFSWSAPTRWSFSPTAGSSGFGPATPCSASTASEP